jgi:hypothetical protein
VCRTAARGDKSGWRLCSVATFALTGKVSENPKATSDLHKIRDGVCEHIDRSPKEAVGLVPTLRRRVVGVSFSISMMEGMKNMRPDALLQT